MNMYKSMRIWAMNNLVYNEETVHTTPPDHTKGSQTHPKKACAELKVNNTSATRLCVRVACMVDNEVQLQCVKRKMIKKKCQMSKGAPFKRCC